MTVALLPPVTNSGGYWCGELPITEARRYVRGAGNSRWHRIRSGILWPEEYRITLHYWCGQMAWDRKGKAELLYVDEVDQADAVCGTCVGRALGAGQEAAPIGLPRLRFDPRWQTPPPNCPGSRSRTLWDDLPNGSHNIGRCLACGDVVSIRACGRGYSGWGAGPVIHAPGADLVEPCPFHAWKRIVRRDDKATCGCGWPDRPAAHRFIYQAED